MTDFTDNPRINQAVKDLEDAHKKAVDNHDQQTFGKKMVEDQGVMVDVLGNDLGKLLNAVARLNIDGKGEGLETAREKRSQLSKNLATLRDDMNNVHKAFGEFQKTIATYEDKDTGIPHYDEQYNKLVDEHKYVTQTIKRDYDIVTAGDKHWVVRKKDTTHAVGAAQAPTKTVRSPEAIAADIQANTRKRNEIVKTFIDAQGPIQKTATPTGIGTNPPGKWMATEDGPQRADTAPSTPGPAVSAPSPVAASPLPSYSGSAPDLDDSVVTPTSSSDNSRSLDDVLAGATPLALGGTTPQQSGVPGQTVNGMPVAGTQATPGAAGAAGAAGIRPPVYNPNAPKAVPDDAFQSLLDKIRGQNKKAAASDPLAGESSTDPGTFTSQGGGGGDTAMPGAVPLVQPPSWTNASTTGTDGAAGTPKFASAADTSGTAAAGRSTPAGMPMMPPMMPPGAGGAGGKAEKADRPKIANQNPEDLYGDDIKRTKPIVRPQGAEG